ncbi:MAG: glycosyltransferase [Alphaproteobacteria bacterium]|nr:glycosyltransferase [Alphaproteobacteria bacterium]
MNILFVHQNCPGQYKHLAPALAARKGWDVRFLTRPGKPDVAGVTKAEYDLAREPGKQTHRYLTNLESAVLYGQAAAQAAEKMRQSGFVPDVIVGHAGWGETMYLKDVFPTARLLGYFEFYYRAYGSDVDFELDRKVTLDDRARIRTKNAAQFISLEAADWGVTPTLWQKAQLPREFHGKVSVIHEGFDTDIVKPLADAKVTLPSGVKLTKDDEVVTYVARNLEPYRGFPIFMQVAEEICRRRPNAHILIVGADGVSYGRSLPDGQTYREKALSEVEIDPARVHFLGRQPYEQYLTVLQISAVHVYLTYPFVLSWSMLEAMGCECLIVGSDTPPVREVIRDGENGLLVDFYDHLAIADRVDEVLDHDDRMAEIRKRARRTIERSYSLDKCLRDQIRMVENLAEGRRPGNVAVVPPAGQKAVGKSGTQRKKRGAGRTRAPAAAKRRG